MTVQPRHAPYTLINTFTAVDGGIDALIAFQRAQTRAMRAQATACGWLGNTLYRCQDGTRLIIITHFQSMQARQAWAQTELFQRHVQALKPLIKAVSSVAVTFLAAHGLPCEDYPG